MSDTLKINGLISAMYLDIITGDVHIKNQYTIVLLSHVATYLRNDKLEKYRTPIERFRSRLHNAISMILHNYHQLPAYDTRRETEIKKLEQYFDTFVIKIDNAVADPVGIEQIGIIEDIETLEYCMNVCYSASGDYAEAMSGITNGLTQASNKYAYVINEVTPILYRYNLVNITENNFAAAARIATQRLNQPQQQGRT